MRTPSIKTLQTIGKCDVETAKKVKWALTHSADDILTSGKYPQTEKYNRSCYHYPGDALLMMVACDEALGTYGVEYVKGRNGKSLEYCNVGDAYASTLCFEFERGVFGGWSISRVFVGCYGDWVERNEERNG